MAAQNQAITVPSKRVFYTTQQEGFNATAICSDGVKVYFNAPLFARNSCVYFRALLEHTGDTSHPIINIGVPSDVMIETIDWIMNTPHGLRDMVLVTRMWRYAIDTDFKYMNKGCIVIMLESPQNLAAAQMAAPDLFDKEQTLTAAFVKHVIAGKITLTAGPAQDGVIAYKDMPVHVIIGYMNVRNPSEQDAEKIAQILLAGTFSGAVIAAFVGMCERAKCAPYKATLLKMLGKHASRV